MLLFVASPRTASPTVVHRKSTDTEGKGSMINKFGTQVKQNY